MSASTPLRLILTVTVWVTALTIAHAAHQEARDDDDLPGVYWGDSWAVADRHAAGPEADDGIFTDDPAVDEYGLHGFSGRTTIHDYGLDPDYGWVDSAEPNERGRPRRDTVFDVDPYVADSGLQVPITEAGPEVLSWHLRPDGSWEPASRRTTDTDPAWSDYEQWDW